MPCLMSDIRLALCCVIACCDGGPELDFTVADCLNNAVSQTVYTVEPVSTQDQAAHARLLYTGMYVQCGCKNR